MIEKLDKFIEEHLVMDELDGVERTLVEFNFNDWIRFKRETFGGEDFDIAKKEEELPKKMHEIIAEKDPHKKTQLVPIEYDKRIIDMTRGKKKRKSRTEFPEEMEEFVKDNLDLGNRDLAEEVNKKFGLDMDGKRICDYMTYRKIEREKKKIDNSKKKPGMDHETELRIEKFILNLKTNDAYLIRDKIIEKFEKNLSMTEIRKIMSKKIKDSTEESVEEEVKRITKQMVVNDVDDDLDEMGLDS